MSQHHKALPHDAKLWPEGWICRSVPHTNDKILFLAHLWVPTLELNQIYRINVNHFDFDVILWHFCDVMLNNKFTWSPLQPVFWRTCQSHFHSTQGSINFILYRVNFTNKISFVETGKKCGKLLCDVQKIAVWIRVNKPSLIYLQEKRYPTHGTEKYVTYMLL